MDIGKIFDSVLKPIADKYNKENEVKCRYELSDSKLWGLIFDGQLFEVTINWIIAPGLDKPLIKKHPIEEDNQTEIIQGVKYLKFDNFKLVISDNGGIKKDLTMNGVKHTFRYKVVLDGVPQINILEPRVVEKPEVTESMEKPIRDFKKKLKEVKDGKR